jgi:ATP/maltotriose-dependent transcriptional regulator MalT
LLYGDAFELGRTSLAMTPDEGARVLSSRPADAVPGLLALAEGWPAVLNLAARVQDLDLPDPGEASALYEFFAEELFQDLPEAMQVEIEKLALAPVLTFPLATLLFGDSAAEIIEEAVHRGVLTSHSRDTLDIHPLLRDFLGRKLARLGTDLTPTLTTVVHFLIEEAKWDDAFSVIERFGPHDLVITLVEKAMATLLAGGRMSTLSRWLAYSNGVGLSSPFLDLAEAEIAFRDGAHVKAQALAVEAQRRFDDSSLTSRALALAGECAYQLDQSSLSLDLHRRAASCAKTSADRKRAIWGQFLAAIQLEDPTAEELLEEVEESHGPTLEGALRVTTARLLLAAVNDHVEDVVNASRPIAHLVDRCSDAKIRTSFLSLFGSALAVTAHYADALDMVDRAKRDAHDRRLVFTLPFTLLVESTAAIGLRSLAHAAALLDECRSLADRLEDVFLDMSARAACAKMLIAQGAFTEAVGATAADWSRVPGPVVLGELLGVRALALACANETSQAIVTADRAEAVTRGVEARTFAACARAVLSCRGRIVAPNAVRDAFSTAMTTQNFDGLVAAVRGEPALALQGVTVPANRKLLAAVLERSNDYDLARLIGLDAPRKRTDPERLLSRRETDVLTLLCRGQTNKQIAATLFLSEATVKVHVRHILKKLGVRTRTQAVLRVSATGQLRH